MSLFWQNSSTKCPKFLWQLSYCKHFNYTTDQKFWNKSYASGTSNSPEPLSLKSLIVFTVDYLCFISSEWWLFKNPICRLCLSWLCDMHIRGRRGTRKKKEKRSLVIRPNPCCLSCEWRFRSPRPESASGAAALWSAFLTPIWPLPACLFSCQKQKYKEDMTMWSLIKSDWRFFFFSVFFKVHHISIGVNKGARLMECSAAYYFSLFLSLKWNHNRAFMCHKLGFFFFFYDGNNSTSIE